ncbi:MAG: amino acid adenylation domain protein [Bacteroidetes bacterium]|nr:amino acid adenylation domain protein [Bacteroidota bacterium]
MSIKEKITENFWIGKLEGSEYYVLGASGHPQSSEEMNSRTQFNLSFPADIFNPVSGVIKEKPINEYKYFAATLFVLVYKYTLLEQVLINTPVFDMEGVDNTNHVFLKINVNKQLTIRNLIKELHKEINDAYVNHHFFPEVLHEKLALRTNVHAKNYYSVGMSYQSFSKKNDLTALHGLYFEIIKKDDEFLLTIFYREQDYLPESIRRLAGHYFTILNEIIKDLDMCVGAIEMMSKDETHEQLYKFNTPHAVNVPAKTVPELFEQQVLKTPDAIALVTETASFNYRTLNERANQLAAYLVAEYKLRPDDLVGIVSGRNEWMLIIVLAVLKTGAAYVPVDPDYPQKRIDYIKSDSNCKVWIDEKELEKFKQVSGNYSTENFPGHLTPQNIAYVIYTSGSTGVPKGVVVEHQSLVSRLVAESELLNCKEPLNSCLITNYVFDVSLLEIFLPLLNGGKVTLPDHTLLASPDELHNFIIANNVQAIQGTPTFIKQFVGGITGIKNKKINTSILTMCVGGESLSASLLKEIKDKFPGVIVNNHYGPTETTIDAIVFENVTAIKKDIIGKPLTGAEVYILDKDRQLLPVGATGEIYIGGIGVARGYLNNEELTAGAFVPNPFISENRLYKTGDMGKWSPDGTVVFAGRKDEQIKIRGYRVELGDIENAIRNFYGMASASVTVKQNTGYDKVLVAHLLSPKRIDVTVLKKYLKETLPFYMIPEHFVQVDSFPVTAGGKTDKQALMILFEEKMATLAKIVPPSTTEEKELLKMWANVLGVEENAIGVKHSFFELGGHSLKATRLLNQIHKAKGVRLELQDLFMNTTIELQAKLLKKPGEDDYAKIEPVEVQDFYELSSAQLRIWILSQFEEVNVAYNMPGVYILKGPLDFRALESAFVDLMQRHEVLRTVFKEHDGEIKQFIYPSGDLSFQLGYLDLREKENEHTDVGELIEMEMSKPFNLSQGPLLRAGIIQKTNDEFVFCFVMHHIAGDAWSMGILFRELLVLYNSMLTGALPGLAPLQIQYKDYSTWQNKIFRNGNLNKSKTYWLNQFSGELTATQIRGDYSRPPVKTYNGQISGKRIDKSLVDKLKFITERESASLFMGLLSVVKVLLFRYSDQQDITLGSPVAGRDNTELEDQLGVYINMLPLRTHLEEKNDYLEVLRKVKQVTLDAYKHQMYPFNKLVEDLNLKRDPERSPLFDIVVVLQNADHNDKEIHKQWENNFDISVYNEDVLKVSKFDLTFAFAEISGELDLSIEFNTDIYRKESIDRMIDNFEQLLRSVVEFPEESIAKLDIISGAEKKKISAFNGKKINYPLNRTYVDLFEEHINSFAQNTVISANGNNITYAALNEKANNLASYIRKTCFVKPDDLIAVKLQKGEWLLVSLLAVLKSGAGFVPIDPSLPEERVNYILSDAKCKCCINDKWLENYKTTASNDEVKNPLSQNNSGHLSYVIYTSGSTGAPKGVMIENRSLVNLCFWHNESFHVKSTDRVAVYASIGFDAFVWEVFPYLLNGASLFFVPEDVRLNVELLAEYYTRNEITVAFLPTQIGELFLANDVPTLRLLLLGGDKLNEFRLKEYAIVNNYGPTENTVVTTSCEIKQKATNIPIGNAISNSSVYILDTQQNKVPVGVVGEIYISGAGLARGYLNNEPLTAASFIQNPFEKGTKLYKTGDLARWRSDGNIEFFGRNDNQVKIRGNRIELGEIENALRTMSHLNQVFVTAKTGDTGNKNLVAYVISNDSINDSQIKTYLGKKLPAYMIPAYIVQVDNFPLSSSGKIDAKALPHPDHLTLQEREYVEPATLLEKQWTDLWKEVLGERQISVTDNFFDIGGNSILVIKLSRLASKAFVHTVPVSLFFQYPNIRSISEFMQKKENAEKNEFDREGLLDDLEKFNF